MRSIIVSTGAVMRPDRAAVAVVPVLAKTRAVIALRATVIATFLALVATIVTAMIVITGNGRSAC